MNWFDINIVKNLTLKLQKAFDKGEIDKLYQEMYNVADQIAASETKIYTSKLILEYRDKQYSVKSNEDIPGFPVDKIAEYRNSRTQFHIDQMQKILELYVKSKGSTSQT